MEWQVPAAGFLGTEIEQIRERIIEANAEWFALARDSNLLMMRLVETSLNSIHVSSMDPKAVAVRLLLRASGVYQGALLMAERGMYVEARIMARSLLEVTFSIGALSENEAKFMQMLRDDHFKSRRQRFVTLQQQGSAKTPAEREALQQAIDSLEKSLELISPKAMAKLSRWESQYFDYQCLSDDSAHVSASSLDHYIEPHEGRKYWTYKVGAGSPEAIEATLFYLIFALIPILVGAADIADLEEFAEDLDVLVRRFHEMPVRPLY